MAKTIGFNFITVDAFIAAYKWIVEEGTCCLAYGDWTNIAESLLLTPEQKELRKNDGDIAWSDLDIELIEAIVMLPVLKMLDTDVLYWNSSTKQISVTPIAEPEFMLDFTGVYFEAEKTQFTLLEELSEYCSRECAERVVNVTVTIKHVDNVGADQCFTWNVATALDYNMLENAISGAINTTVEDGNQVVYFFEVK